MNKSLYHFGIFFLGLIAACGLFQNIAQLLLGMQIYVQDSYIAWFLAANAITIIGTIFLLKYYHYRRYWSAFNTGIISAIVNLFFTIVLFIILTTRVLSSYYIPILLISLSAGIVYALSLIFSGTGKKPWLKLAGVYILVISLILVSSIVWSLLSKDLQLKIVLEKIAQWTSIAGSLISFPFIMHFLGEIKALNTEDADNSVKNPSEDILIAGRTTALLIALVVGVMLTSEGYSSIYWGNQSFENAKKLDRLFETRTFVNSKGDTLHYHLLKPLNFDPNKKYPLVVNLPYGGQPGTDKIRQIEGAQAAELLSTDINRTKYPAFLFVPNCPAGSGWGGIPNYPTVDSLVYEAISELDKEPGIDVKRRYVTGISRGGYGSWHFICTRPDMFAAAIPVCGGENPKLAPKIVNVAVWAFHGAKDKNVPVDGSRDMINALKKAGGNPKYTEYPNEGHNIWDKVINTPGLWDWLFAQKRN